MEQYTKKFVELKKQSLENLYNAIQKNLVDEKVINILRLINKQDEYVTTSSCAGRIIIMQLPEVGDKKHATFLGRWHRPVVFSEVKEVIHSYTAGQLWFIIQSPIFHVASKTVSDADILVKIGIAAGFKHSGFKTGKNRVIAEICSTERMDVPIGIQQMFYPSDKYLQVLINLGNDLLKRSQEKLDRLETMIQNSVNKKD